MIGVYCILNKCNNKRYIGSSISIEDRINNHRMNLKNKTHDNKYLLEDWYSFGQENFEFEVLETLDNLECIEQLRDREMHWIVVYNTLKEAYGYNLTTPVKGGGMSDRFKPKGRIVKETITFLIDKDVLDEFNKYCKDNAIFRHRWIEMQIRKFLEENKKTNN